MHRLGELHKKLEWWALFWSLTSYQKMTFFFYFEQLHQRFTYKNFSLRPHFVFSSHISIIHAFITVNIWLRQFWFLQFSYVIPCLSYLRSLYDILLFWLVACFLFFVHSVHAVLHLSEVSFSVVSIEGSLNIWSGVTATWCNGYRGNHMWKKKEKLPTKIRKFQKLTWYRASFLR